MAAARNPRRAGGEAMIADQTAFSDQIGRASLRGSDAGPLT